MDDLISRQAVKELAHNQMREKYCGMALKKQRDFYIKLADSIIDLLPTIQPEIVRCKDCKYWHSGSCEYPEHVVNSQDYYVGDIETEAEYFCGYAERREVTT